MELQFLYVLHLVPRLHAPTAWTDADNQAVADHFQRLKTAAEKGIVILAGRTAEPLDQTFGIVIFEAPDEPAAREFMESDPTVALGVMTATLHPYSLALLRKT
ncbi:MAG TPA: YciI family protein [Burkholderiaceae bacterium]|nr:YciI family protein [Burkholderiaceae bacterium]